MTYEEIIYEKGKQILFLRGELHNSDYKAIKFAEGELTEEEYAPIREQRKTWRKQIRTLETEIAEIKASAEIETQTTE